MERNISENICVYYKDVEGLRFEKQEHIIPAFLGGKKMLKQGVVSDQANELFSGIEKHVAMESFINLNRMFLGPGKRGSKNPKKSGGAKISVMCSPDGRLSLGYILMGKPKQIMQCFWETDAEGNKFTMAVDADQKDTLNKCVDQFWGDLKKIDIKKAIYISDSRIPANQKILGNHKGKWFLAYNSMLDKNIIGQEVNEIVNKIKNQKFIVDKSEEHKIIKEYPKFEIKYAMDMNKFFRFCAKVAFNVSTYLNGKKFMLDECFDDIRKAIISGESINNYVNLQLENPIKILDGLHYAEKYGKHLHSVICIKHKNGYYATVNFYGFDTCAVVKLTDNLNVCPVTVLNGFFCDWENGKEFDMSNFITELVGEENFRGSV